MHCQYPKQLRSTCGEGWIQLIDEVYANLPDDVAITQAYQKILSARALHKLFWIFSYQTYTFTECRLNYFFNLALSIDVSVNHTAAIFLIAFRLGL
jgi:hypothetical protein